MKLCQRLLLKLKSYLPRPLPVGVAQFDAWVSDIITLSGLSDNLSTRKASASLIIQLPSTTGWISLRTVTALLLKAASNQVALSVLRDSSGQPAIQETSAEMGPTA